MMDSVEENPKFWKSLHHLLKESRIVIDRPKGFAHPRFPEVIYPVDYGFLENTSSMDGGGIDVYYGTYSSESIQGILVSIDLLKRDTEIKILYRCTAQEVTSVLSFANQKMMSAIFIACSEAMNLSLI